jgi:two-component system phosphate regulon sensor histidine kinase PhoR
MTPTADFAQMMNYVIHELKGPLAGARGFIELIQLKGPLNAEQERYATRALESLEKMDYLVRMVLEVALVEADHPLDLEHLSLNELVADALLEIDGRAEEMEVATHFTPIEGDDVVEADYRLMVLVLNNLLSNALKYNHRRGEVHVEIVPDAAEFRIVVRDSGRGIPPADVPYVFDRFFRSARERHSSTEGHGLGLAITRSIVEKHGGVIGVESTLDVGSAFTVTLPRRQTVRAGGVPEPMDGVDDGTQEPEDDPMLDSDDPQGDSSRLR